MTELAGWPLITLAGMFGLAFGSFANVVIHRWPAKLSLVDPPSTCPACGARIRPVDNIPVASWLVLGGRCRACGIRISIRYPLVEVAVGGLWAGVAAIYGASWLLPVLLAFAWALVVATLIDIEHQIIPNKLTYPLAPVTLGLLVLTVVVGPGGTGDLIRAVIVGLVLPAGMLALSEVFRVARGQIGMGMGDIKLAVSIGLVLGFLGGWYVVIGLYATIIAGVIVAGGLLAAGRAKLATRIPFGPYLAVGSLVAVLGGRRLIPVVERLLGLA